jgi:pyruvate dehydrogenase E2 component (dihydrolipoamide acetyltransferase)
MAKEVRLPQLGQTMEEGTIVTSLIKEGESIEKGDVIFEIETDKATLEMESPAAGFVKKILVEIGATVPVNTPIVILGEKEEEVSIDTVKEPGGKETVTKEADKVEASVEMAKPATQVVSSSAGAVKCDWAKVIRLPQLGQTMEEGTIVTSLIKEGDKVGKGDVIFEVETDKATLEMESTAEGVVKNILIEVGQTIAVNTPIVILAEADKEIPQEFIDSLQGGPMPSAAQEVSTMPGAVKEVLEKVQEAVGEQAEGGRVFASPRAKAVAKELGVDLSKVKRAKGAKRIVEADVREFAKAGGGMQAKVFTAGEKIQTNRLQRIVAEKMVQSKREIPCFYLTVRADVTEVVKTREKMNKAGGAKVSFNDFIIKAVANGLEKYPIMTGQLAGDFIEMCEKIDIGLAIATDEGLVAPLVKDADKKTVKEIAEYSKALIERTRAGKLSLEDLEGGCITVSNLGGFGVEGFIPIVVPGQCSILGIGRITDTCVPSDGSIFTRKMMNMTLSVDHKVANGAEAAQFLDFVKKQLEHPAELAG